MCCCSYDEETGPSEGKVKNPNLAQHLAHFGLDIKQFKKTEKSTLEMELDMNQKYTLSKLRTHSKCAYSRWEWSRCIEQGATLETVYGPGFTGLINIGSSCYMNSVSSQSSHAWTFGLLIGAANAPDGAGLR